MSAVITSMREGPGPRPFGRRDVLRLAGGLAVGAFVGRPEPAAALGRGERTLSLLVVHTGETLSTAYFDGESYHGDALRAVDRLLRDHYTDEIRPIDPSLLDHLVLLARAVGSREPFHVLSGYRSAATNALLRREQRHSGVADHSFHVEGRAVDVFLPDRRLVDVRRAAVALCAGGVGYYPASGFVHVDTGPVRLW
jgi:uncharacterized protein YcbK (DUF882 family)